MQIEQREHVSAETGRDSPETDRVSIPITGMSCAACAARIEKSLRRADGVQEASVNFATHRATVEYDPRATDTGAIVGTIRDTGYGADAPDESGAAGNQDGEQEAREREYEGIRRRF